MEGVFALPERPARRPRAGRAAPSAFPTDADEIVLGRRVGGLGADQRLRAGALRLGGRPASARRPAARLLRPARAPQADCSPRRSSRSSTASPAPSTWSAGARYREAHAEVRGAGARAGRAARARRRQGARPRPAALRAGGDRGGRPGPRRGERAGSRARAAAPRRGPARGRGRGAGGDRRRRGRRGRRARACWPRPSAGLAAVDGVDPALDAIAERVRAATVELDDAASELRSYLEGIEAEPGRLERGRGAPCTRSTA